MSIKMKKIYTIFSLPVICMIVIVSCTTNDSITSEIEEPIYNVDDNVKDAIQHEKNVLYNKYKTYLITNPLTRDYKFNFQRKNNLKITAPVQSTEVLQAGINLLHDTFLDIYSEDFKKKNMPFSILLADSILFLGQETSTPYYHAYVSQRFIALGGVRPNMLYTDSIKQIIKGDINSRFWIDYMNGVKELFSIPEEFADVSKSYYRKDVTSIPELGDVAGKQPHEIDYYQLGFVNYNAAATFYDKEYKEWWIEVPDEETDKRQWVAFCFNTPKTRRDAIIAKYPKMKQKYLLLKRAFANCEGFDIDRLP